MADGVFGFLETCLWLIWDICLYWQRVYLKRLWGWVNTPTQKQLLIETLQNARTWEEYVAASASLDTLLGNDHWRFSPQYGVPKGYYDHVMLGERVDAMFNAVQDQNIAKVEEQLRMDIRRHLGGITEPELFNRSNGGTKMVIEEYIKQTCDTVRMYAEWPVTPQLPLTAQRKMELLRNKRASYGSSVLVLQGGSIFGLCHLGVVKAMHRRGLLPRIIAGSATGALMAAWVGVHTDKELEDVLQGDRIDLSAFAASSDRAAAEANGEGGWLRVQTQTLYRRARRFLKSGFVLDPQVLQESLRANVGELTFEEAFVRSGRVLNIIIAPLAPGSITLLNHYTAPDVLIWSAALVSNANDRSMSTSRLWRKDAATGIVTPHDYRVATGAAASRWSALASQDSPLSRLGELYNVNHYIISQARPAIAPLLYTTLRWFKVTWFAWFFRFILGEFQLRLRQLDILGALSPGVKHLLLDEVVPGEKKLVLTPEIRWSDWARLLRNPTRAEVDHWIGRGEKSVWPEVVQLWVRVGVEFELEKAYCTVKENPAGGVQGGRAAVEMPGLHSVEGERQGPATRERRNGGPSRSAQTL